MYPFERSLVKELADEAFALVGVNSDADKDALRPRLDQEQITWRSFWNGPKGTSGPLSRTWNVNSWPTIYLIDHKGVIRYKNPRESDITELVRGLLEEAARDEG